LSHPTRKPALQIEVGQVGQLQTCEKAYEIRNLANLAKFFSMFRWGFEDLYHPTRKPARRLKVAKLANFKLVKKPMKYGTLPTFVRSCGGTSKTCPHPTRKPACQIEVGQVGQLQTCKKAYETGNLANFSNFCFDVSVGHLRFVMPDGRFGFRFVAKVFKGVCFLWDL